MPWTRITGTGWSAERQEKSFAPGVERDKIYGVEERIDVPMDEFIVTSIGGLQLVAGDIDLA